MGRADGSPFFDTANKVKQQGKPAKYERRF